MLRKAQKHAHFRLLDDLQNKSIVSRDVKVAAGLAPSRVDGVAARQGGDEAKLPTYVKQARKTKHINLKTKTTRG